MPSYAKAVSLSRTFSRRDWIAVAALLLGVAVVLRSALYADPLYGTDEQFYVVAGRRILEGATPYAGVFDRKPFGLLALFAGLALVPGEPLLVAKLAATLAAALGALLVVAIAAQSVSRLAALVAGCWYLVLLGMFMGAAGQSPVFYNPLIAGAALLALRTDRPLNEKGDLRRALAAMLLAGLAIQVKTTAVFEAAAIGGWLLLRAASARGARQSVGLAVSLGVTALLPTLLVGLGFLLAGHFGEWWFATVRSQGLKTGALGPASLAGLPPLFVGLTAPLLLAGLGVFRSLRDERLALLVTWAGATLVETFAIGQFYLHYALPFVLPAAILAAPVFAPAVLGPLILAAVAAVPVWRQVIDARAYLPFALQSYATVGAALPADVKDRCLFIYSAPMSYYLHRRACTVTPYLFIDHLDAAGEAKALPVDATAALAAALARRPGVILTIAHVEWNERNRTNDALLAATLARRYRQAAVVPHGWGGRDPTPLVVWRRADLP